VFAHKLEQLHNNGQHHNRNQHCTAYTNLLGQLRALLLLLPATTSAFLSLVLPRSSLLPPHAVRLPLQEISLGHLLLHVHVQLLQQTIQQLRS